MRDRGDREVMWMVWVDVKVRIWMGNGARRKRAYWVHID